MSGPQPHWLFYPDDALVDPRDVMRALRATCSRHGVQLLEGLPTRGIHTSGGMIFVDNHAAKFAVLAAGAWSSSIPVFVEGKAYAIPGRGRFADICSDTDFDLVC